MSRAVIDTIEEESESQMGTPTDTVIELNSTQDETVKAKEDDVSATSNSTPPPTAGDDTAEGAGGELGPDDRPSVPNIVIVSASTDNVDEQVKLETRKSIDSTRKSIESTRKSIESTRKSIESTKMAVTHSTQGIADTRVTDADRRKSSLASKAQLGTRESFQGRAGGQRSSIMSHERDRLFSARAKSILAGSVLSVRRPSFEPERMKVPKYMNTYRLESKNPFKSEAVTAIIKEVMTKELDDVRYDAATAPKMALSISNEIRARVKLQQYDRYKIVCLVDIGEKQAQSIYSAFRCLWDTERDMYAMYNYDNVTLYAVGTCYGIYRD